MGASLQAKPIAVGELSPANCQPVEGPVFQSEGKGPGSWAVYLRAHYEGVLNSVDPQGCLFPDEKNTPPLLSRHMLNVLFSTQALHHLPPTSSPFHSHLSPLPTCFQLSTHFCASCSFPSSTCHFTPLCFCTCYFICLECLQIGKGILVSPSSQVLLMHQGSGLPWETEYQFLQAGCSCTPRAQCWVLVCLRPPSRLRSAGPGARSALICSGCISGTGVGGSWER